MKRIDQQIDAALGLHLIGDNYAAPKRPKVKPWLKRHPRFDAHFIPISSAWLNIFERWFRELADKRIRRGAFRSAPQLVEAIEASVQQHAPSATPSIWTAQADESLAKVSRAVLNNTPSV